MNTHHTTLKGDTAVGAVINDLTTRGLYVFIPLSSSCPYDLIACMGGSNYRIQVKYSKVSKIDIVEVKTHTSWANVGKVVRKKIDKSLYDVDAVLDGDTGNIYYVDTTIPLTRLRKSACRSSGGIWWHEDFMLFPPDKKVEMRYYGPWNNSHTEFNGPRPAKSDLEKFTDVREASSALGISIGMAYRWARQAGAKFGTPTRN